MPVQEGGPLPPLIVSLVTLVIKPGKPIVGRDTVLIITGNVLDDLDCLHLVVLPTLGPALSCLVPGLWALHMLKLIIILGWLGEDKLG